MEPKRIQVRVLTGPQVVVFTDKTRYIMVFVQTLDLNENFVVPMYLLTKSVPAIGTEVCPTYCKGHTREFGLC